MKITSLSANISDQTITVSGTAESGVLATQVIVYDESGENIVAMQSTGVEADNSFSTTIAVGSGAKYIVKVADYDGGEYSSVAVTTAADPSGSPNSGYAPAVGETTVASESYALPIAFGAVVVVAAIIALFAKHFAKR